MRCQQRAGIPAYVAIGARLMPIILRDAEDHAGRLPAARSPRRRHRRPRRGRAIARPYRGGARRAARAVSRARLRIRVPDKPPPPIYSFSRGIGVHVFSAMPVIVDNRVAGVIYTSRTPSNIFEHLYQERGKFMLAALAVILGDDHHRPGVLAHHHPADARADRPRRAHRRGDRDAFQPLAHTAPASLPSCRTASSTWPSNCRGARTTSRPSRPTSPTN